MGLFSKHKILSWAWISKIIIWLGSGWLIGLKQYQSRLDHLEIWNLNELRLSFFFFFTNLNIFFLHIIFANSYIMLVVTKHASWIHDISKYWSLNIVSTNNIYCIVNKMQSSSKYDSLKHDLVIQTPPIII